MSDQRLLSAETRDACIRAPLILWLQSQHPDDGSTEFVQEFKMPRPSARIDLAVVNGEMAGFEIKSDADNLGRLANQVPAFSRVFDRLSIVTTKKHLTASRRKVPAWWGIILFSADGKFAIKRSPKRNSTVCARSLLFALSRLELVELGRRTGHRVPASAMKHDMVGGLVDAIGKEELLRNTRDVIRLRCSR